MFDPVVAGLGTDAPVASATSAPPGRLRVLTLTTLFPSCAAPRHGIFVQTRLRKLQECMPADVRVIAPVPWFPSRAAVFGRYAAFAATPYREQRDGFDVAHPRYLVIPKFGMALQPRALASAALRTVNAIEREGHRFDVIDAHYFYPDGVAAAMVARRLGRPFVVTARGSDVNLIAQQHGPRQAILAAARDAARVIAVSAALKQALVRIGVDENKIEVLRNGVDTRLFAPDRSGQVRQRLALSRAPLVLSVGNLVAEKGHDLVVRAVARIGDGQLVIVGHGPEQQRLESLVRQVGLAERTRFVRNMPQAELAKFYSAADVLALGSEREGWPNVLLEAMACGTPVVATDAGGVREIVGPCSGGRVVCGRSVEEFTAALAAVLASAPDRTRIRAFASSFDWESIVARYFQVLARAAQVAGRATPLGTLPAGTA